MLLGPRKLLAQRIGQDGDDASREGLASPDECNRLSLWSS